MFIYSPTAISPHLPLSKEFNYRLLERRLGYASNSLNSINRVQWSNYKGANDMFIFIR